MGAHTPPQTPSNQYNRPTRRPSEGGFWTMEGDSVDRRADSFAALLRRYRGAKGLTQEELAERSGVSVKAISMLERGVRTPPRATTVEFLAAALRLDEAERAAFDAARRDLAAPPPPHRAETDADAAAELAEPGAAAAAATRTLPRAVTSFTGRDEEMARLLAAVTGTARPGPAVEISAIDGMAGVGKTTFAVRAAHQLASRFPDGQLFLDLHAHTAGQHPVKPADALRSLLLTIGVSAQRIPPDLDARAALWRDRVAGRRLLLLLDDAASHEQVRPLVPGASGCLVLVTSRRRLTALEDAESLTLRTLPPAEAAALFVRLAGTRDRDADPASVARLVELCGHLPLAIRLLAGQLRSHPTWSPAYLLGRYGDGRDPLVELRAEDVAVAAVFQLSYRALPAEQQRLFRRLGLHPGRDIDAHAAAALAGVDVATARRQLEALYTDNLIEEPVPGRFRLHDLMRAHARALAAGDDESGSEAASGRLVAYYIRTTGRAVQHIARRIDATMPA